MNEQIECERKEVECRRGGRK